MAAACGAASPTPGKVLAAATVNLGVEHTFKLGEKRSVKARLDVVKPFDKVYELRDGSGIGVGAPQYGARSGCMGVSLLPSEHRKGACGF
jgi:hypothetical protein